MLDSVRLLKAQKTKNACHLKYFIYWLCEQTEHVLGKGQSKTEINQPILALSPGYQGHQLSLSYTLLAESFHVSILSVVNP